MGSSVILAAAAAFLGQSSPTPAEQRTAEIGMVLVMMGGLVVTLLLLRWVAKKERDKNE